MGLLSKVFPDQGTKDLRKYEKIADQVLLLEEKYSKMTDEELKDQTRIFKERLALGETLDDILVEAFAVLREASFRTLGMKHFKVQIIGGIVLHKGNIAEMKTGEGKTLVATLPAYLNALEGKGVHVITVNDYLAKRDSLWMGKIYEFLGLTVGCVIHEVTDKDRKEAYQRDITYGTNNEFGFDYLRDNMVVYKEQLTQRPLNYAIVDEVDSILIDEARTPLIISGRGDDAKDMYQSADRFIKTLKSTDYTYEEKDKKLSLTEEGISKAEKYFKIENFGDPENMEINHHVQQALRARIAMKRDVDYIVKDGEIVIVDEFTGRLMFGRRFSNGLHQAIEAKEGVLVKSESKTLATITLQNYFRMYQKLSGMTGTAKTEEDEFVDIYNMNVIEIPTNKPVIREDLEDKIFANTKAKYLAIVDKIEEINKTGQPVLVGTISIEKSELISSLLKKRGIKHNVLNAKEHEREAEIVSDAGKKGQVTIATNMAGRGTDIILGGAMSTKEEQEEVKNLGGLYIIGTERHEARRIDNQLRGRSGRQGDPGVTEFYISLEDDLVRLFGGDRVQTMMNKMGMSEEALAAGLLTKTIENAQKKVESKNFEIRKYVLRYDNVMNKQREVIYDERKKVLFGDDVKDYIMDMTKDLISEIIDSETVGTKFSEEWDFESINKNLKGLSRNFKDLSYKNDELLDLTPEKLKEEVYEKFTALYSEKEKEIGLDRVRELERMILLRVVDNNWMTHIDLMEDLKQGIGLRGYGQQDPAAAYASEGFNMFEDMISSIKEETVKFCYNVTVATQTERKQVYTNSSERKDDFKESQKEANNKGNMPHAAPKEEKRNVPSTYHREMPKIGRNDPCPCGSGKKYKNCCGKDE